MRAVRGPEISPAHVALVGFMGAGKSAVGPLVAAALGRPFVDLDAAIEAGCGRTVAALFAEEGEAAFRGRERAALQQALAEPRPLVLAVGGGCFVDPEARQALLAAATCVCLQVSAEIAVARLTAAHQVPLRPLLAGPEPQQRAADLWRLRQPLYRLCPLQVDTEGQTPAAVSEAVLAALHGAAAASGDGDGDSRPTLVVHSRSGSCPVTIATAAGAWLGAAVAAACPGPRVALVTDVTVAGLHAGPLQAALVAAGKQVSLHAIAAGEDAKVLGTAADLYGRLVETGLGRADAVVALGGGVVGDVAGFVASTYLRGIRVVQVPTTTLAAVDASVGGKTAVNLGRGKNLVGTFHPPAAVFICLPHLRTQPPARHAGGLVEALKMAATHDAALFAELVDAAPRLLAYDPEALGRAVGRAVRIKAGVVQRDEREAGERAALNYGHTVGHAIEAATDFSMPHGEAVALGMLAEAAWAHAAGLTDQATVTALAAGLTALNMPTDWQRARVDMNALGLDKKRHGADVRLPVVPRLGTWELRSVPWARLAAFVGAKEL